MSRKLIDSLKRYWALNNETIPGASIVEMVGDFRVLIENHRGIISYSIQQIQIKTDLGVLSVSGEELSLAYMSDKQLVINGCVRGVTLAKG